MTAVDYLRAKYQAMGIYASDEWLKTVVPELLLMPTSVSELGVSISRASRESIEKYYRMECSRLGLVDRLTEKATVRFL